MPIRSFVDSRGGVWRVWATVPTMTSLLGIPIRRGWLTFESLTERRRLSPVPKDWTTLTAVRLEALCATAERVRWSGSHRAFEID